MGHPTNTANIQAVAQQAAASTSSLSPREQATMKNLVSGVTRMRRRLDYVLSKLTSRNTSAVEPVIRQVLRLALYELEYEGLAPHALDEHVELARRLTSQASGYAPGFVNGVLREAGRRAETKTLPSPQDDLESMSASTKASSRGLARALSLQYSHPTWLASRWLKRFGREEAEALMEHNNRPPVYTVRVNPLRGTTTDSLLESLRAEGVEARVSSILPKDFIEIQSGLQTLLAKGFVARGECLVQDVSAGLVVAAALDPQPGERVLDACAAPGGKTMFCASRMHGKGFLTALDTSAARLQALGRQAEAAGVPKSMMRMKAVDLREFAREVTASLNQQGLSSLGQIQGRASEASQSNDSSSSSSSGGGGGNDSGDGDGQGRAGAGTPAASPSPAAPQAVSAAGADVPPVPLAGLLWDRVLLDAPCSGSGVLAKRADMRWRRTAQDVEDTLVPLQAELLDAAALLVRPGGLLVYSICSIEEDEGLQQAEAFLARHANFQLEPIDPSDLAHLGGADFQAMISPQGCIATFPHRHGVADGSFALRLRRVS